MEITQLFSRYTALHNAWDEMYKDDGVRDAYQSIHSFFSNISQEDLSKQEAFAKRLFMSQGITFTVYSSGEGVEKISPFDIIPRVITRSE